MPFKDRLGRRTSLLHVMIFLCKLAVVVTSATAGLGELSVRIVRLLFFPLGRGLSAYHIACYYINLNSRGTAHFQSGVGCWLISVLPLAEL